jgi:hypothetical protein
MKLCDITVVKVCPDHCQKGQMYMLRLGQTTFNYMPQGLFTCIEIFLWSWIKVSLAVLVLTFVQKTTYLNIKFLSIPVLSESCKSRRKAFMCLYLACCHPHLIPVSFVGCRCFCLDRAFYMGQFCQDLIWTHCIIDKNNCFHNTCLLNLYYIWMCGWVFLCMCAYKCRCFGVCMGMHACMFAGLCGYGVAYMDLIMLHW